MTALTRDWIKQVCKFGQRANCCRYLVLRGAGAGWHCAKLTTLRKLLDDRVANGEMQARGDHCPGVDHSEG